MGVVVRAVPARVPVLPGAGGQAGQGGRVFRGQLGGRAQPAQKFLGEIPVPYPSYLDPDSDIAELLGLARNFPTTTFYDREGERVYTKPGGYASEADLADDVREYALEGARAGAGG